MKNLKKKKYSYKNSNFGVGSKKKLILRKIFGLNIRKKPRKLRLKVKDKIKKILSKKKVDKSLNIKIQNIIQFYIEIKSYKGLRHKFKYPVRGQRTRTNAKTIKKKNLH